MLAPGRGPDSSLIGPWIWADVDWAKLQGTPANTNASEVSALSATCLAIMADLRGPGGARMLVLGCPDQGKPLGRAESLGMERETGPARAESVAVPRDPRTRGRTFVAVSSAAPRLRLSMPPG